MQADERAAVAQVWSQGDYARVAERLAPAADAIASQLSDGHARRALDVATGTGSVARRLAARGWAVSGADLCVPLLEQGRRLAEQDGLVVDWTEAPLDDLPFGDGSFDAVTSSFGLIFAGDPATALAEIHRILAPGGTLTFTAWTATGYMARMTAVIADHLPATGPGNDPFAWGDPDRIAGWLGDRFSPMSIQESTLPWHFGSTEEALDFYFDHSPGHIAAARAAGERFGEMRRAVGRHLEDYTTATGAVEVAAEFTLTSARRT